MQRDDDLHGQVIERKHDDTTLPKLTEYEITHKEEHFRIRDMKIRVVHYEKIRDAIIDYVCAHLQGTKACVEFNNEEISMRYTTIVVWITLLASIPTLGSMATWKQSVHRAPPWHDGFAIKFEQQKHKYKSYFVDSSFATKINYEEDEEEDQYCSSTAIDFLNFLGTSNLGRANL